MPIPGGPGAPSPLAVARILRWALAGSVIMYGILTIVLRDRVPPTDVPAAVHAVLHVIAGVLVLAGLWLFRRIDATSRATRTAQPGPRSPLPPTLIAGWALFESVGVLGLVASLLGGNGQILILVSVLLLLLHPPREEWFKQG